MDEFLHIEILPDEQKELFELLSRQEWLKSFYLVGGTALALQLGHRTSLDFDFFIERNFNTKEIIGHLKRSGKFELFDEMEDTINGLLNSVNISFLKYEYPLIKTPHKYNNIIISDILDIALMKLNAISGRGNRKDFVDIYFLLNIFSLSELFEQYENKYGLEISNNYHLLKSLVYFEDAEKQPMPEMIKSVEWSEVKDTIIRSVKDIRL